MGVKQNHMFTKEILEAYEKQKPKSLIWSYKSYMDHYNCPNCNKLYINIEDIDKYCSSCGQRFKK